MKKEDRDKFGNFVHEERKKEEEVLNICQDIMKNSGNELAVSMRYFYGALSALRVIPSGETSSMGTDGKFLYVNPGWLIPVFMEHKVWINRLYLHELFHCLFCHLWSRKEREQEIWDLACDIAVEHVLDEMYEKAVNYLNKHITRIHTFEEFEKVLEEKKGFVQAPWCGETECELQIKEKTAATSRCITEQEVEENETCICCGKKAKLIVNFAKSY